MIPLSSLLKLTITIALLNAGPQEVMPYTQAEATPAINAEEYLVYSALIDQKYTEPNAKRMFTLQGVLVKEKHLVEEVKLVVIESNTRHSFDSKAMDDQNVRNTLSAEMPRVVEETFQDFTDKNRRSYTLSNNFSLKIKTELISERERQSYFVNNTGRMDAFFGRFPGSQGTLAFSRVGFSPSKDKALVYVEARQDFDAALAPLWAWDTYFALLTKGKDGWKVYQVYHHNRRRWDPLRQSSLTVDLARCAPATRSFVWGLGSGRIDIKGLQGDECVLHDFSEIEGGYSQSECRVPVMAGELSIYEGGIAFYYSLELSKHCKVIKGGNLMDMVKPK